MIGGRGRKVKHEGKGRRKQPDKAPITFTLNAMYHLSLSHLMAERPLNSIFTTYNPLYHISKALMGQVF